MVSKRALEETYQKWCLYKESHTFKNPKTNYLVGNTCNIMDSIRKCNNSKTEFVRVAMQDDKIQGAISFKDEGSSYRIGFLSSAPWNIIGVRGRLSKVGSNMVKYVFKRAMKNNRIKYVDLIAHTDAEEFYKKLGFEEVDGIMRIGRSKIGKIIYG